MAAGRIAQSFRRPSLLPLNSAAWRGPQKTPQLVAFARLQSSSPQPQQDTNTPSATRQSLNRYDKLRRPWLRVFLGAFFTYQVLYWGWEKMRTDEIMEQKTAEVKELEEELEAYKSSKTANAGVA